MFASIAIGATVAGIVVQLLLDGPADAPTNVVRVALLLPAALFIAWWCAFPGLALDEREEVAAPTIDVDARIERIERSFDATAVPRASHRVAASVDETERALFRASVRRSGAGVTERDHSVWGVPRPPAPASGSAVAANDGV